MSFAASEKLYASRLAPDSVSPKNMAPQGGYSPRWGRLSLGGLTFILLTIGAFWFQFNRIQAGERPPAWDQLQWGYLFLMVLCLPLDTVACGVRIWVVCRVLKPGIRFWTCLKAEWANLGVSMLTPSNSGGGFGQVYILNRGGVDLGAAIAIGLITFLGSMVGLLCLGLYALFISRPSGMDALLRGAIWGFTIISAFIVLAAIWPGLVRRLITLICEVYLRLRYKQKPLPVSRQAQGEPPQDSTCRLAAKLVDVTHAYQESVRKFVYFGKGNFVLVCLLSLSFLLSRCLMAFFCMRFLGIQASSLGNIMEIQMALIFLIYFAPTPGGSGLAEGASLSIMSGIVPIGFAPYYNLLWRFTTLYLPAAVGLLFLLRAMLRDTHRIIERRHALKTLEGPDAHP